MSKKKKIRKLPSKSETYNEFVQQIEIVDVRLISAKIENISYSSSPTTRKNTIRMSGNYTNREGFVDVYHRYYLTVKDAETSEKVAKLFVIFGVTYSTKIPMTDEIFDVFNAYNIPLNTWPYFREFAQSSFAKMGWLGLVTPTFKTLSDFRHGK